MILKAPTNVVEYFFKQRKDDKAYKRRFASKEDNMLETN